LKRLPREDGSPAIEANIFCRCDLRERQFPDGKTEPPSPKWREIPYSNGIDNRVEQQPSPKPDQVQQNEGKTAHKAADRVAQPFDPRVAGLKLLLLLGNGLDMFLNVYR
jgi:hypothetical protein